jgi:hypothetical protein
MVIVSFPFIFIYTSSYQFIVIFYLTCLMFVLAWHSSLSVVTGVAFWCAAQPGGDSCGAGCSRGASGSHGGGGSHGASGFPRRRRVRRRMTVRRMRRLMWSWEDRMVIGLVGKRQWEDIN